MSRLYAALIRHAEYQQLANTPSAHQPFPLTENGVVQARGLAGQLRRFRDEQAVQIHSSVDSSHLLRAWQTAQILKEEFSRYDIMQSNLESYEELAERSVGICAANLTIQQIEVLLHEDPRFTGPPADWKSNSRYCLPFAGAESLLIAGERVARHISQRMAELHATTDKDCLKLFIGHGAAFRHAAYQLGVLSFDEISRFSMHHARPVFLQYQAGGCWQHTAGEWKLRAGQAAPMD